MGGIIFSIALIAGGIAAIIYERTRMQDHIREIKFMQTKSVQELTGMFSQMEQNGLGQNYSEFVELKGIIDSDNLVQTPFSNQQVAYYNAKLMQVTEIREQYRDNQGNMRTRTSRQENKISEEKPSEYIYLKDSSSNERIVLEANATGCKLEIAKTFDRFEPKNNLGGYRYFNSFSWNRYGAETLGFKMVENTIAPNQNLYVIGEAFKVGNEIHIGKPQDSKRPFVITTKSEEDFVNTAKRKSMIFLIGGGIAILAGIIMFFVK